MRAINQQKAEVMMNSGIDKSANHARRSFGEWATESEFSWVDRVIRRRPEHTTKMHNNKVASRRAAAYWESRK